MAVNSFWSGRRVLVTGHTGFKGTWLGLCLSRFGAEQLGIALEPIVSKKFGGLFDDTSLELDLTHCIQDIGEAEETNRIVGQFCPEVIFHLAAQPLVNLSYEKPVETWNTNVMGTINVLEAARKLGRPVVVLVVTTDKVYKNKEWEYSYREVDRLGGHDPYSSSKAAVELVVDSWRRSFFDDHKNVAVATVRAGNVIGGGDYAENRIIPDVVRGLEAGDTIEVKNPNSTRPWQHVLDPLAGYLLLAQALNIAQKESNLDRLQQLCGPWNFGPYPEGNRSVQDLVETALEYWPGTWSDTSNHGARHESELLSLAIDKSIRLLDWKPKWTFDFSVNKTIEWYHRNLVNKESARSLCMEQIEEFYEF